MDTTVLIGIATSVVGGLSAAIAALYRRSEKAHERLNQKLDKCEEKHGAAQEQLLSLSTEVGTMRGHIAGYEKARDEMKLLPDEICKRLAEGG